jgi:acyl carrier protein
MDRVRVLKELNEIFCDNFDDDTIVLSEETNANDIEDWDSLEQINLLTTIEKKYNIKFKLIDVKNL